jgi:hypothetical protein
MKKKKTIYIWVLIILAFINLAISPLPLNYNEVAQKYGLLGIINFILCYVYFIISLIWITQAFALKKRLIIWTHVWGALTIFSSAFAMLSFKFLSNPLLEKIMTITTLLLIVISAIIWITFVKHLKKSIFTGKILLS